MLESEASSPNHVLFTRYQAIEIPENNGSRLCFVLECKNQVQDANTKVNFLKVPRNIFREASLGEF